jgi:outer membrane protein OmpA-like peptidoglycan-associated protein
MKRTVLILTCVLTSFTGKVLGQASGTISGKFDFIPGEKVIFFDDFTNDPVGEFPAKWNSNVGGDIVTHEGSQGKWLRMKAQGGNYIPTLDMKFPENITVEFDVLFPDNAEFVTSYYSEQQQDINANGVPGEAGSEVTLSWSGTEFKSYSTNESDEGKEIASTNDNVSIKLNKVTHVAMWIQKSRYRLYFDTEKVFDIPNGVFQKFVYNRFRFSTSNSESDILIGNFKIAVGAPDTRNQLITKGRFSTSGILFDVNSDKIKAESHACIKEIATVLKENPGVKVAIVGHTDSDGDEAKNLDLSKRRALAVKNYLKDQFGVDITNVRTDGKGEGEPMAANTTPEGKAQNRRVEFIKE